MIDIISIIAQIVGAFAVIFWVISIQRKKHYKILLLECIANILYTVQYMLLGVFLTSFMNFTSAIRCFIFYKKRKENQEISKIWLIIFLSLIVIMSIFTYDGYLSLIPVIITIFYTIASWIKEANFLRIVFIIAAVVWIYYNYMVGAYVSIIGNVFEIISGVISLIRFSKKGTVEE